MQQQQDLFSKQLQGQIDAANKETADLKTRYDAEAAAAAAAAAAQQAGPYAATASQSAAPATAQTTTAAVKKDKPKSSLKISTAGVPAAAGTGLNIGI
jgi:hypothetical protein